MKWLQRDPDRNGMVGAILALVIILCVFAAIAIYVPDLQQRKANAGFKPDWDCSIQAKGDPVCIRKPTR